jgi:hypothetical protein
MANTAESTTKKPAAKRPAKVTDHQFEALATQLATAEQTAKARSADASQARADRQNLAVGAIKAAIAEKVDGAVVRSTLLGAGVLKGTVSKIVTVIDAINSGVLQVGDIKSLNGAYSLVKEAQRAAAEVKAGANTTAPQAATGPVQKIGAQTPDEALKLILDAIKNAGSEDAVLKAASEWITKVTDGITKITSKVGSPSDED